MGALVLHPGALGDLILSIPALELLRRTRPGCRQLTVAANLDHAGTALAGVADRLLALSSLPLHRLYGTDPLGDEDFAFWRKFSRIVSWTGAGDSLFTRNLQLANPHATIAAWRPSIGDDRHVARIFVESLGFSPSLADPLQPRVRVEASSLCAAGEWLQARGAGSAPPLIAIHPGAGSRAKRWPLERFRAVAGRISQAMGGEALVIEGPAEPDLARLVSDGLLRVHPVQSASLDMIAGLLSRCAAYIGNDSGISHLAASVGTPSLVLFGPMDPQHWAPLGPRVTTLTAPRSRLQDLSEDQVWRQFLRLLRSCSHALNG